MTVYVDNMNEKRLIVKCKICDHFFDYDLVKYVSAYNKNLTVHESVNGYNYFDIDGLTVTFFSPMNSDELIYHIVICEIDDDVINTYNVSYLELMRQNPIFTFDFNEIDSLNDDMRNLHDESINDNDLSAFDNDYNVSLTIN